METNIANASVPPQETFEVSLDALESTQAEPTVESSHNPNVHTNNEESRIEIDERYKDLDPVEGRIRTLQSQKDVIKSDYDKLFKDYTERDQAALLLDQMVDDEGLLMAFVSELKPDLVKSRNAAEELKTQLKKEFGEDFKPSLTREEADRDDPFGKDAEYYSRIDELKVKLRQDSNVPQTVKEYLARKQKLKEAEDQKYETERNTVKAQYKMNDEELKAVSGWAVKLKFADIVRIHRILRKLPTGNPNLTSVAGGGVTAKSDKQKWLDEAMPFR